MVLSSLLRLLIIHSVASLENKTFCVRRDGDFQNHYNDQFTGFSGVVPQRRYTCDLYAGKSPGSNVLYARGGIGNQLHCMAALQRIDPHWRAFDAGLRAGHRVYMSDEFLLKRTITPIPSNIHDVERLREKENVWPFPPCQSLVEHKNACNCWHVLALQGDACGRSNLSYQRDESQTSLKAETVAAFAKIPISQDLRGAAARFVLELRTVSGVSATAKTTRRNIIGVHARTGHLDTIDGKVVVPPKRKGGHRRSLLASKYASMGQAFYDTKKLLHAIRQEALILFYQNNILPAVVIASDNVFAAHALREKINDPYFFFSHFTQEHFENFHGIHSPENSGMLVTALVAEGSRMKVVLSNEIANHSATTRDIVRQKKDMLEMLVLSHSDVLIKDNTFRESTYSEAAWWLGGGRAKRVHVPHPRRDILPKCLREESALAI